MRRRRQGRAGPRNIVFFPLARCLRRVRAVALALDATNDDDECKAVWQRFADDYAAFLWRAGAEQPEIDRQLDEFARAVTWELVLLAAS
jgi:hypothetical protein